jgi:predicted membrane-bound spermidine synthase
MSASIHAELLFSPSAARAAGAASSRLAVWLHQACWWATPALTGAVVMAQELVAFRLYAPYFGYSIYVWGCLISVVMAALSLGYALGGWLADRSHSDRPLYTMILGSALYQWVVLFAAQPVLRWCADQGEFTGVLLASLVIFVPPMTALAAVGPYLIRLLGQSGRVGSVAGKVYALSTLGSIAGLLATSFLLVPCFGTLKTLAVICTVTALTAAAGLLFQFRSALFLLGLSAFIIPLAPSPGWSPNTLWAVESPYNLVRVVRNGPWLLLKLNDERGVHTIRREAGGFTRHYYDQFALGPLLVPAHRLLVLGLGGGGSIAATRLTAPDIAVDAVEIDPKVVAAAVRFFGMDPADGRLRIHVADARPWIARNPGQYDLVHVDLYQGGPYIPFYLVTREFFETVRAHMSSNGLLMMNLLDTGREQELLRSTVATLKQVFPSVLVLPLRHGNHMLLAFSQQTPESEVRARLQSFHGATTLQDLVRQAQSQIFAQDVSAGATIFTDDFAPVEDITRRMLAGE